MACEKFRSALGLQARDYFVYGAFIESVVDPAIVTTKTSTMLLGTSISVMQGIPFADSVYEYLQNVAVVVKSAGF